jgi:hypothetical protein
LGTLGAVKKTRAPQKAAKTCKPEPSSDKGLRGNFPDRGDPKTRWG